MILADTSAWVEYDRGTGSDVDRRIAELIGSEGPLGVTEPVVMEVLAGAQSDQREADLRRLLGRCHLLGVDAVADFDAAGRIYRQCRRAGVTPRGLVECMIASVAHRHGASLLAHDAELSRVATVIGIKLDRVTQPLKGVRPQAHGVVRTTTLALALAHRVGVGDARNTAPPRSNVVTFLRANSVVSHARIRRSRIRTGAAPRRFVRTLKSYFPSQVRFALGRIERFSTHLAWSVRCATSRRSILGDGDVVVCMTSHGSRIRRAHHAIESIARGTLRPSRMILWLDEELKGDPLPHGLRRLQHRGLEVGYRKDDMGPHMKYFPYVNSMSGHSRPLVTADDDKRYSKEWLNGLVAAHEENGSVISVYFSRRIEFAGDEFAPYVEWPYLDNSTPDHRNAVIGFCGAVYPPAFLNELQRRGELFRRTTPRQDDVWLTFVAVTSGFPVRQIQSAPMVPNTIPGAEALARRRTNLVSGIDGGGNDQQFAETFGDKPRLLFEQQASRERHN